MAYVDIELDDIDYNDLIEEVTDRMESVGSLSELNKAMLIRLAKEVAKKLSLPVLPDCPSLADQMKLEFASEMLGKYTENQLREMESDYSFKTKKLR